MSEATDNPASAEPPSPTPHRILVTLTPDQAVRAAAAFDPCTSLAAKASTARAFLRDSGTPTGSVSAYDWLILGAYLANVQAEAMAVFVALTSPFAPELRPPLLGAGSLSAPKPPPASEPSTAPETVAREWTRIAAAADALRRGAQGALLSWSLRSIEPSFPVPSDSMIVGLIDMDLARVQGYAVAFLRSTGRYAGVRTRVLR